jgi:protein-disulfide isomerase
MFSYCPSHNASLHNVGINCEKRYPVNLWTRIVFFSALLWTLPALGADDEPVFNCPVGDGYQRGAPDALVTLVEVGDFQCPFCSRFAATLKRLLADPRNRDVRHVYHHNPLSFHKDAMPAALAAEAAGRQGKFWEMHDILFKNPKALKANNFDTWAGELKLDMAKFKADMKDAKLTAKIKGQQAAAAKLGARGTPTFFINGEFLSGTRPQAAFQEVIDRARRRAKAKLHEPGVTPANVYAKLIENGLTKKQAERPSNRQDGRRRLPPPADVRANVPAAKGNNGKGTWPAKVVIVEYSDFQCPYCSKATPAVNEIMKTYGKDVYFIYKHNPLGFHPNAEPAARAAAAAGLQGKFFEMHDKLFANYRNLTPNNFSKWAGEIGLNVARFKTDFASKAVKASVAKDKAEAQKVGARGTPNFFINGRLVRGARPFAAFKPVIDEELIKANALIAKGTPRAKVYREVMKEADRPRPAPEPAHKRPARTKTRRLIPAKPGANGRGTWPAKVVIVEYSDFQCPFCSKATPVVNEIMTTYGKDLYFIYKHNPLSFHSNAEAAARAATAAGLQGKFWAMHDKLFANYRNLTTDNFNKWAGEIGLNVAAFKSDFASKAVKALVAKDQAEANKVGARGTPNFFVNGVPVRGALPFRAFKPIIDKELKKANALMTGNMPLAKVYGEVMKEAGRPVGTPAKARPAAPEEQVNVRAHPKDASWGDKNAKVTVYEFSDFQCPFCSRGAKTINEVQKAYPKNVRIVFKNFPLSFHRYADLAARAGVAAHNQGKFWMMHDQLFANSRNLGSAKILGIAQQIGLNMTRFRTDLNSAATIAKVEADKTEAARLGIRGTPNFVINGTKITGAQPFARFKEVIEAALTKP